MTDKVISRLEEALACLKPISLVIRDDSEMHAGHAGNSGGGHYTITIISKQFAGLPLIKRHRLVYGAAKSMMTTDIHALSIDAKTPDEIRLG